MKFHNCLHINAHYTREKKYLSLAEDKDVEAPLAKEEDDIPSVFGNTLQTLRKRTKRKSSTIEKHESAMATPVMGEKNENKITKNILETHQDDKIFQLNSTKTDSNETIESESLEVKRCDF